MSAITDEFLKNSVNFVILMKEHGMEGGMFDVVPLNRKINNKN